MLAVEIPENIGLYEEMQRLRSENYHLKKQLKNKNNELKGNRHTIRVLVKKVKESDKKQHYKNGKRGTMKNG